MPGTFSITTALGFNIRAVLTIALYNMLRESSIWRGPAREKPWHGGPPTNTSTDNPLSSKNFFMTSTLSRLKRSSFNAVEFSWLYAKVFRAISSTSTPNDTEKSASINPLDNPPQPQNKSKTLYFFFDIKSPLFVFEKGAWKRCV